jgi:hypothetical protein
MIDILGEIHQVLSDPALDFLVSTAVSILLARQSPDEKKVFSSSQR